MDWGPVEQALVKFHPGKRNFKVALFDFVWYKYATNWLHIYRFRRYSQRKVSMKTTDQIQRVLELPVLLKRAWRAISTPEGLSRWFSEHVSFEPQVGAEIVFEWDDYGKKYGCVEAFEPQQRFGFRWLAGEAGRNEPVTDDNSTLVIMELEEIQNGTRLTVTESGFSRLPKELQTSELVKNDRGWDYELAELVVYMRAEKS
jgi:uncharacterized protein YndB with AHSA1/START domain